MSDTDGQAPSVSYSLDNLAEASSQLDESLATSPDESATATQMDESPIADIATEEPRAVDETSRKLQKAQEAAREQSGHFAELAKALLNNPDKEAVKAILAEKPHLEREIRRRYPEEIKKFSQDNVTEKAVQTNPLLDVVNVAEKELQVEQAVDARMFQQEKGIADDEMAKIKSFAESLSKTDPSLTYKKALELATSIERPTRSTPQKNAPMGIPRDEVGDYGNESQSIGFNGQLDSVVKSLKKSGARVTNENGGIVISL